MATRGALVQFTNETDTGILAELQGSNGEQKVLNPDSLAATPCCARTLGGTRAQTSLFALEPLPEATFVLFRSLLGIQHSMCPQTTHCTDNTADVLVVYIACSDDEGEPLLEDIVQCAAHIWAP